MTLSTRACTALRAAMLIKERFPGQDWFALSHETRVSIRAEARTSSIPLSPELFKEGWCHMEFYGHEVGKKTVKEIVAWLAAAGITIPKYWPSWYAARRPQDEERQARIAARRKEEIERPIRIAAKYIRWLEARGYSVTPPQAHAMSLDESNLAPPITHSREP